VWNKLAQCLCVVVFFAAMYILIQWVTISFIITGNGPIQWAAGWERVLDSY